MDQEVEGKDSGMMEEGRRENRKGRRIESGKADRRKSTQPDTRKEGREGGPSHEWKEDRALEPLCPRVEKGGQGQHFVWSLKAGGMDSYNQTECRDSCCRNSTGRVGLAGGLCTCSTLTQLIHHCYSTVLAQSSVAVQTAQRWLVMPIPPPRQTFLQTALAFTPPFYSARYSFALAPFSVPSTHPQLSARTNIHCVL